MKLDFKILGLVFLIYAITIYSEINLGKFQLVDFEVYSKAAYRIYHKLPLYHLSEDGHYLFKYSPVFAFLFIPFSLLKFEIAKFIFLSLIFISNYIILLVLKKEFKLKLNFISIFCLLLIFLKHLHKEIILGQINILLLCLIVLSIYYQDKKPKFLSFIYTISLFIKPIGLILIPYFLFKRKFVYISYIVLYSIVLVGLSLIFADISSYQYWIIELRNELLAKTDLNSIDTQTLFASLHRLFSIPISLTTILGFILWAILIFNIYKLKTDFFQYFLISSIPLLVCTSNNFYILSIPLIFYLIVNFSSFHLSLKILFIISSLLMSINQYELWGRNGVDFIDKYTPYSLSIIIGCLILIVHGHKKRSEKFTP